MFWKTGAYGQYSPIQAILDKPNFSLEELLDEDDLIQECRTLNNKLIAFLSKPEIVDKLLTFLVEPPIEIKPKGGSDSDSDSSDVDLDSDDQEKRRTRYPFAACEVFCSDVDAIYATLVDHDQLMDKLFRYLDNPLPLSPVTAGYFARVVSVLLLRRSEHTMGYILSHPTVRNGLLKHVSNPSIADVLQELTGADEQIAPYLSAEQLYQLSETSLLADLIALLMNGTPAGADTRSQASRILAAVANSRALRESPLARQLGMEPHVTSLLETGLRDGTVLVPVLVVIMSLMEPRRGVPGMEEVGGGGMVDPAVRHNTMAAVVPQLPRLVTLLKVDEEAADRMAALTASEEEQRAAAAAAAAATAAPGTPSPRSTRYSIDLPTPSTPLISPTSSSTIELDAPPTPGGYPLPGGELRPIAMPYGLLQPPLGPYRLKVVELIALLVRIGDDAALEALIASGAFSACLSLFGRFPFHNMLHFRVQSIVLGALEAAHDTLMHQGGDATPGALGAVVRHLCRDCQLLTWLALLPSNVEPRPAPYQMPSVLRAGYMGHVIDMGNRIKSLAVTVPEVRSVAAEDSAWHAFCDGSLYDDTVVANLDAWLRGRPMVGIMGKMSPSTSGMAVGLSSFSDPLQHAMEVVVTEEDEDEEEEDEEDIDLRAVNRLTAKLSVGMDEEEDEEEEEEEDNERLGDATTSAPLPIGSIHGPSSPKKLPTLSSYLLGNDKTSMDAHVDHLVGSLDSLRLLSLGGSALSVDGSATSGTGNKPANSSNNSRSHAPGLESPPGGAMDDFGFEADFPPLPAALASTLSPQAPGTAAASATVGGLMSSLAHHLPVSSPSGFTNFGSPTKKSLDASQDGKPTAAVSLVARLDTVPPEPENPDFYNNNYWKSPPPMVDIPEDS